MKKQLNCQFDEFSSDVLFNQIIKATINSLIRKDIDKSLKKKLKKLKLFFNNIKDIELDKTVFNSLSWNRNNKYYNVAISVCELIYNTNLPDNSLDGQIAFKDFSRKYEKELANLFENFVLNFYKTEYDDMKVSAPQFKWNLDKEFDNIGSNHLPRMESDIVLENNKNQLIIDTKFYKNILSDSEKLHSGNLYQISTYVANSDFDGNIKGMLLYASLGEDIDYQFKINDHIIYVKTIDLNQNWEKIEERLKNIGELLN